MEATAELEKWRFDTVSERRRLHLFFLFGELDGGSTVLLRSRQQSKKQGPPFISFLIIVYGGIFVLLCLFDFRVCSFRRRDRIDATVTFQFTVAWQHSKNAPTKSVCKNEGQRRKIYGNISMVASGLDGGMEGYFFSRTPKVAEGTFSTGHKNPFFRRTSGSMNPLLCMCSVIF